MNSRTSAWRRGAWGLGALAAGAIGLAGMVAGDRAHAQSQAGAPVPLVAAATEQGFGLFQQKCLGCHGNPAYERAPSPAALREMAPEHIYDALTNGVMKSVGDTLTDTQRRMVSESVAGRILGSSGKGDAKDMPNRCKANPAMTVAGPGWNGWGAGMRNARFQPAAEAGLTAADLPKLKLKWAFGLPNSTSAYSQPTVVGGRVFIGTDTGNIYAIDAKTGCVYWSFRAIAGVRAPPIVGPGKAGPVIYVGDLRGTFYALDARTGRQVWTNRLETNFTQRVTAGATLYQGVLYVPISAWEEFSAKTLDYGCCTAQGAVAAVNAATGKVLWKTYVMTPRPQPTRKNSQGVQQFGPAGGAVWNTPAVDPKQGAVYFGTGDATTFPPSPTSDSVMALDLKTGKVLWSTQVHANDSFLGGCNGANKSENCPAVQGPDWDIPAPVILTSQPSGKRLVLVSTKPGDVLALDPDKGGKIAWRVNASGGPPLGDGPGRAGGQTFGLLWGGAVDRGTAYYGLTDGGVLAMDLADGKRVWLNRLGASPEHRLNNGSPGTSIPGAILIGGGDGKLRALAVNSPARLTVVPDVPTLGELGVTGAELYGWSGIYVPAAVPDGAVAQLAAAAVAALGIPEVRRLFDASGTVPWAEMDAVRMRTQLAAEIPRMRRLLGGIVAAP